MYTDVCRPHRAVGRSFCENVLILVKCSRDSRKKYDWFRCKKISRKLKYLNFKCEQSERYFFVLFFSFHYSAHVPCENFRWRQVKSMSENQALGPFLTHGRCEKSFVGLCYRKQLPWRTTMICNEKVGLYTNNT